MAELPDPQAEWRTRNIGHLLFAATDRCVGQKLRVVHRRGFEAVSEAQMALFLHLDVDGTRLTTLAARAGLTKQSMIELVDRAEALSLVGRRPDPQDGRAKMVLFTQHGLRLLEALHCGIMEAEQGVGRVVGGAFLRELRDGLGAYLAAPVPAAGIAWIPAGGDAWRADNVGRLFSLAARRFVEDVLRRVHERGHADVTHVLLPLFRNLDLQGARLTEIAARSRVTKQSMRELVDRAETSGYVERRPYPHDRRAKAIMFTPAGLAMLDEMRLGVAGAEAAFERSTGEAFAAAFRTGLGAYMASGGT